MSATGLTNLAARAGLPASKEELVIEVDPDLAEQFIAYSNLTGIPVTFIIEEALDYYIECVMSANVNAIQRKVKPAS